MITISILTFNKVEYTKKCLESIFNNTPFPEHRIVVTDNCSTDGTIEYLESLEDKIQIIKNNENMGFAKAHNNIINKFKEDDIVLMNNDVEVPKNWLVTILHSIDKTNLGAAGPAIQTANGLDIGAVLNEHAKGRSLINDFRTKPDWITGSCIYLPRKTINAVGLLDENFQFYYEDVDYCIRIKKAGMEIKCIKEVVIKHNDSTSSTPMQKKIMMENSRKYFANKWDYKV